MMDQGRCQKIDHKTGRKEDHQSDSQEGRTKAIYGLFDGERIRNGGEPPDGLNGD